jgi:hypothetical protein
MKKKRPPKVPKVRDIAAEILALRRSLHTLEMNYCRRREAIHQKRSLLQGLCEHHFELVDGCSVCTCCGLYIS